MMNKMSSEHKINVKDIRNVNQMKRKKVYKKAKLDIKKKLFIFGKPVIFEYIISNNNFGKGILQ